MEPGIEAELAGIDLGDQRLNKRSRLVLKRLAADPQASINGAQDGWKESRAAYRFFDHPDVTPEKILAPHREATEERIAQHPVVLVAQDTSEMDYSDHPPHDAGLLNSENRIGVYDHTHLAVTPEGLCLGVVGVEFFSRSADTLGKADERAGDPIETKESYRWLKGYRLACDLQGCHAHTRIVNVADRESDIYDIFLAAHQHPTPADYVIRARVERCLNEPDPEAGEAAYCKVHDEVAAAPVIAMRQLKLPATSKRKARIATVEVRATSVCLKPPHARSSLAAVTHNVVLVKEVDGPGDGTEVRWLLLTTLPIDSPAAVLTVLDYYTARWTIEVFFRVFKTGCRVEDVQLETMPRLLNCLALYKIVAWRVMHTTYLGREYPDLPCSTLFAAPEWQSVWKIVKKEALPKTPPSLAEFIPLLARLGGYNQRRGDPPPGPQAIWIGIRRMHDFALAWLAFGPDPTPEPTYG